MRLVDVQRVNRQNRAHFLAVSARLMRRILVDFARSKRHQKRGGGAVMRDWRLAKLWLLRELRGDQAERLFFHSRDDSQVVACGADDGGKWNRSIEGRETAA